VVLSGRVLGPDALVAEADNAVDVAYPKHGGKTAAGEAIKILRANKSLSADLKVVLTVERVVPRHQQLVEKVSLRLKAKHLTRDWRWGHAFSCGLTPLWKTMRKRGTRKRK
jgi:hypothetical protein